VAEQEAIISALWPQLLERSAGKRAAVLRKLGLAARSFWQLYAPIAGAGSRHGVVVGQLGQSLDGRIATSTGRSHYINGPEAIAHLHRLRGYGASRVQVPHASSSIRTVACRRARGC
jgi:hypothetical protein